MTWDTLGEHIKGAKKALATLLLSPAIAVATALESGGTITSSEWVWVVVAALAPAGATYAVSNTVRRPPPGEDVGQ